VLRVALRVAGELRSPVAFVGFWLAGVETVLDGMHVPEAAMHEDHFAARTENEIGLARQVAGVQAVAIAEGVDEAG